MARDFIIFGETIAKVRGSSQATKIKDLAELGLATEEIRFTPKFYHQDVKCDDFGPDCPAEVLWNLAEVNVRMTLIHWDRDVLSYCISESMAGGAFDGVLQGAGRPMGALKELYTADCHYMSLLLLPTNLVPWRFLAGYLTGPPVEYPMGVKASAVMLNWRFIPYTVPADVITPITIGSIVLGSVTTPGEVKSAGVTLWDHKSVF